MKRIIAIFTFFLAFSFNANAQEAKVLSTNNTSVEKSSKELLLDQVSQLSKIVKIEESLKNDLTNLLHMRNEDMANSKSEDEKKAVFERYTSKLLSAFNEEQIETLKKEKELRPLVANIPNEELPEFIAKHLFDRNYYYQQAKHTIAIDAKSVEEIVEEIRTQLA